MQSIASDKRIIRQHYCGAVVKVSYKRTETSTGRGKWTAIFYNDADNQISCCPGCGRTLNINDVR